MPKRRCRKARRRFKDPFVKFNEYVKKTDNCWKWTHTKNIHGYGFVSHLGKNTPAHRFSWILNNGKIPDGLCVLHKCDNRICVNPDHLFLGTLQDNISDKVSKGRQAVGEKVGSSKLSNKDIVKIRKEYIPRKVTLQFLG